MEWKMRGFFLVFKPRPKVELKWVSLPNCWEGEASSSKRSRKGKHAGMGELRKSKQESIAVVLCDSYLFKWLETATYHLVLFDHSAVTNPASKGCKHSTESMHPQVGADSRMSGSYKACVEWDDACEAWRWLWATELFCRSDRNFRPAAFSTCRGLYRWHLSATKVKNKEKKKLGK